MFADSKLTLSSLSHLKIGLSERWKWMVDNCAQGSKEKWGSSLQGDEEERRWWEGEEILEGYGAAKAERKKKSQD